MARVALLTVSDGREGVHRDIEGFAASVEHRIAAALEQAGHYVVVRSRDRLDERARSSRGAPPRRGTAGSDDHQHSRSGRSRTSRCRAARELPGPLLLFSNIDPQYPGMVGMLAAAGALDQIGRSYGRAWGDVGDPATLAQIEQQISAAAAVQRSAGLDLRADRRPPDGHVHRRRQQRSLACPVRRRRRGDRSMGDRPPRGRGRRRAPSPRLVTWLERHAAGVHYDGDRLTPELLERQIRSYYVMRALIEEWNLDFCGIKGQPELTDHFATMDVAEAFLNDPYDWDGPKEPVVCSTEADMDGALTMQILKSPVRHSGALRGRAPLPRGPERLGPLQLGPARDLVRGTQRRSGREPRPGPSLSRRSSTSRPAAPRSITSRHRESSPSHA